jgi:hypothetical protein
MGHETRLRTVSCAIVEEVRAISRRGEIASMRTKLPRRAGDGRGADGHEMANTLDDLAERPFPAEIPSPPPLEILE